MPQFHYKASEKSGKIYENTITAANRFEVYSHIKKEGGMVISVEEKESGLLKNIRKLKDLNMFGSVTLQEKIMLTRNLAAMMEAGLSLSRALSVLERQTKNSTLKSVLLEIGSDIRKGNSLNEALEKHDTIFSRLFVSMVKAGEESGKLGESLKILGAQMERSYTLKRKIKGALMYPVIIVVAMIIIGILMLVFVVPTLTQTFEELGVELPPTTRAIIAVSDFLTDNTILAILLLVVFGLGFFFILQTVRGKRAMEFALLHLPIVGNLIKQTNAARTARTLSSLISSGVEMLMALSITREVIQNSYFQEVIKQAEKDIQEGVPISKSFIQNEHLYPVLLGEMVSVGEETGKLSEMLLQIAEFYEGEVEQKTKDMSTVIEPFLILIVGAVVGFFAISMISPIYSLSDSI